MTARIAAVRERSILDADGREHEVDTIVFGTGFLVANPPVAQRIRGRDGRSLAEVGARTGMTAYRDTTVAGFPDLFFLVGPNTGLGHSSIVYMIESQVAYVIAAVEQTAAAGVTAVEPRAEVQDAWNAALQRGLAGSGWSTGGCSSWYVDAHGRNTTLWPTSTLAFRRRLSRFDLGDYLTRPAADRLPAPQSSGAQ